MRDDLDSMMAELKFGDVDTEDDLTPEDRARIAEYYRTRKTGKSSEPSRDEDLLPPVAPG